ncbi:hypothetical protein M899_0854 [Bacteriovorax sp. BSW11_IV]|uniref:hypothetical protein n=1 Tax=Bacteriovorax sp. BSW11_IV TaxID=1353529 RepID=UPI000389F0E6|nr:hypothetical protein [Bacteriovorax sp. BSW11_IV]EQC42963.1 hypothetical protein M899_0854 [Bacteriovorax sp. BSW11_IV]
MNNNHKDFKNFLDESHKTPEHLDSKVMTLISNELQVSHSVVFSKILGVQGFIGILTMLFCPQFEMSLTNNYDLFHFFHRTFGHSVCMIICGSIFLGSGAFVAGLVLNSAERKHILNSKYLYALSLSAAALSGMYLVGAQFYLNSVIYWTIGALISQIVLFILSSKLKYRLLGASS